jgi:hypothetical protein
MSLNFKAWMITLFFMGLVPLAQSEVPDGYYKGRVGNADGSVFVKRNLGYRLGLVLKEPGLAGIFRIEELSDGTQAWSELFQVQEGVIGDSDGELVFEGTINLNQSGRTMLHLRPTSYALQSPLGCKDEVHAEKLDGKFEWTNPTLEQAKELLNGSGTTRIQMIAPGLFVIRKQALDAESVSGRTLSKNISSVVIPYNSKGFWGRVSSGANVVVLTRGSRDCWSSSYVVLPETR